MEKYHHGLCEATEWGKRYGKNLEPQSFFAPGHQWNLAKDKNWGPWSCCGGPASSPGCRERSIDDNKTIGDNKTLPGNAKGKGIGAYIQFLINERSIVLVEGENNKCWLLKGGRTAKKRTEGTPWVWLRDFGERGET